MNDIMLDLSQRTMKTMGDIDQVQKLVVDMRVTRMLRARRNEILQAIGDRTCEPTLEVLNELGQLEEALGIAPVQFDTAIVRLRAELKEEERETYRQSVRAQIAVETDEIGRQCLEHSLALIDDPTWVGYQE